MIPCTRPHLGCKRNLTNQCAQEHNRGAIEDILELLTFLCVCKMGQQSGTARGLHATICISESLVAVTCKSKSCIIVSALSYSSHCLSLFAHVFLFHLAILLSHLCSLVLFRHPTFFQVLVCLGFIFLSLSVFFMWCGNAYFITLYHLLYPEKKFYFYPLNE